MAIRKLPMEKKSNHGPFFSEPINHLLAQNISAFEKLENSNYFHSEDYCVGMELECSILNENSEPNPINFDILKESNNHRVVPEMAKYTLEFNCKPERIEKNCFTRLERNLTNDFNYIEKIADKYSSSLLLNGFIPSASRSLLTEKYLSNSDRYNVLNEFIKNDRSADKAEIKVFGHEKINIEAEGITAIGPTSSMQVHLLLPSKDILNLINVANILAGPMVAVAANSGLLFGENAWHDSRILMFEQSVGIKNKFTHGNRVGLGHGYLNSITEYFQKNILNYNIYDFGEYSKYENDTIGMLNHFNGTVWHWIRPVLQGDNSPHIRLEFRPCSSGPTIVDSIANLVFFVGLSYKLSQNAKFWIEQFDIIDCENNFYSCAQNSLNAKIKWLNSKVVNVNDLLINELVPLAQEGLVELGIIDSEIEYYINKVIRPRLDNKINGAMWMQKKNKNRNLNSLTKMYLELQKQNIPVGEWPL